EKLARQNRHFVQDQLTRPDGESLFIKGKGTPEIADSLAAGMTDATMSQAAASVDAASLIFMHSILDGVALDYCRVTAMLAPERWADLVKDRQIKLEEVKGATYDQLLRTALGQYFERLERESLLRKVEMLYRACDPPKAAPSAVKGYTFDRERLERI